MTIAFGPGSAPEKILAAIWRRQPDRSATRRTLEQSQHHRLEIVDRRHACSGEELDSVRLTETIGRGARGRGISLKPEDR